MDGHLADKDLIPAVICVSFGAGKEDSWSYKEFSQHT